jgi:Single-strand binding protein family
MGHEKASDIACLQHQFGFVDNVYDPLAGDGVTASLEREAGDTLTVQLFPDTGIATVETRLMRLALRGARAQVDEANGALELRSRGEHEWVLATIGGNGSVLVTSLNDRQGEGEQAPAVISEAAAGSITPEPESTEKPDPPNAPPENEKSERVTLVGRVGTEPRFRTTKAGALVGTFPLAVHDEERKTSWHTIVAFKDRAEKLKGVASKGAEVEVVGYVHTSEYTDNTGITKERREVWASVVKSPMAKE